MPYFIYDEEYAELSTYDNQESFQAAMDEFDFLGRHCGEGFWSFSVDGVIAGFHEGDIPPDDHYFWVEREDFASLSDYLEEHKTHGVRECNVEARPEDLDEDGYSQSLGDYWGDPHSEYNCMYEFYPLKTKEQSHESE